MHQTGSVDHFATSSQTAKKEFKETTKIQKAETRVQTKQNKKKEKETGTERRTNN